MFIKNFLKAQIMQMLRFRNYNSRIYLLNRLLCRPKNHGIFCWINLENFTIVLFRRATSFWKAVLVQYRGMHEISSTHIYIYIHIYIIWATLVKMMFFHSLLVPSHCLNQYRCTIAAVNVVEAIVCGVATSLLKDTLLWCHNERDSV